jgi:hypothetical protein
MSHFSAVAIPSFCNFMIPVTSVYVIFKVGNLFFLVDSSTSIIFCCVSILIGFVGTSIMEQHTLIGHV